MDLFHPQNFVLNSPYPGVIIWLEPNPQYRDNNLQLRGHLQDNTIRGNWSWITFSGVSAQGTFVARK